MSDSLGLMSWNNFLCSTLDHSSKPTVSIALGQVVGKLVLNEDLCIVECT